MKCPRCVTRKGRNGMPQIDDSAAHLETCPWRHSEPAMVIAELRATGRRVPTKLAAWHTCRGTVAGALTCPKCAPKAKPDAPRETVKLADPCHCPRRGEPGFLQPAYACAPCRKRGESVRRKLPTAPRLSDRAASIVRLSFHPYTGRREDDEAFGIGIA